MTTPTAFSYPSFSLVQGGPLFQIFRRAHLTGEALELLHRRVLVIAVIAWLPLLLISAYSGHLVGGAVAIPFLHDVEAHVRFLVALPILIAAELIVHRRIRQVVVHFVERGIVSEDDMPKFRQAIASAQGVRNSAAVEVVLLLLVYTLGLWVWRNEIALSDASWYAIPDGTQMRMTPAGYWYAFVSVPIFQFLLLRWYMRLCLWFWFLFKISRLDLQLIPTHPDKSGGLGFLAGSTNAFAPILLAQGAVLAGLAASQIFFEGQHLLAFKVQIIGFLSLFVLIMLVPLTVFAPSLVLAKRRGLAEFGRMASRYTKDFENKWLRPISPPDEALLGSADIQSLADLCNSFSYLREMRFVPFGVSDVVRLASIAAVPFLPLTLTMFSLEELADYLLRALF